MMHYRRLIVSIGLVLATLLAPIATAQLSDAYAGWAEGPEGFLLTEKERKEWGKITSDAEAGQFIALFWARRNPEPGNPFNTFKAEFDAKVRFADDHFGYANHRGSISDRGRVLILIGRPDSRQIGAPSGMDPRSGQTDNPLGITEVWFYHPASLPEGFKIKGSRLVFMFYEEKEDSNIFTLSRSNRESFKAMSALVRAPDVYLLHPDLDEVPKAISIPGASPASAAHLAWLDVDDAPFDDVVIVMAELGVSDGIHRPMWVHLELPRGAPTLDLVAGRVTADNGEVVSNFETAVKPIEGQFGTAYHLSFPLDEGSYTIDVVGGAGGEPLLTQSVEAEVSAVPASGTWMSPIWLGLAASPKPDAKLGEAFTVGGWHLTPICGPQLTRTSDVAYFGFVVRPLLDEEGTVDLEAQVRLKRDGKPLGRALTVPLESSQILGDLYMYGNSIDLAALPAIGPYNIEFEIVETNSGTAVARSLSLEITE